MSDRHQTKPYPLRMSDGLRQSLKEAAEQNHRSLNQEIVARLQESLDVENARGDDFDKDMEDRLIARLLARMAERRLLVKGNNQDKDET